MTSRATLILHTLNFADVTYTANEIYGDTPHNNKLDCITIRYKDYTTSVFIYVYNRMTIYPHVYFPFAITMIFSATLHTKID